MAGSKALVIAIAIYLAATPVIQFVAAWANPHVAGALGSPPLRLLPSVTIGIVIAGTLVHSGLVCIIMTKVWRVIANFARGRVFTREVVVTTRDIGIYLILRGVLDITTLFMAIGSGLAMAENPNYKSLWIHLLDLPVGALCCGVLCLIVARAFAYAMAMATEIRLTV